MYRRAAWEISRARARFLDLARFISETGGQRRQESYDRTVRNTRTAKGYSRSTRVARDRGVLYCDSEISARALSLSLSV